MQVRLNPRRRLGTFRLGETVAHNIPTGFWHVWQPDVNLLHDEFQQIWDGEGDTFQACDRIFFVSMDTHPNHVSSFWGHRDDPIDPDFWPEVDPDDLDRVDAWRNASAWVGNDGNTVCALSKVADFNSPTNPRTIRVVISRALYGLVKVREWSLTKLEKYVEWICERLSNLPELKNACMGWYLMDDTFSKWWLTPSDLDLWEQVIDTVHQVQKTFSLNLPFFFNYITDGGGNLVLWENVKQTTGNLYEDNPYPPPPIRYRRYTIPDWMKEAILKKEQGGRFPDDAIRVLQPYYYPWESNQWNYTTMPPWFKWNQVIRTLNDTFPASENPDLQFQPILEAGDIQSTALRLPGHADMHKQIRVLLSLEPKHRITCLWLIGWTVDRIPWPGDEGFAKDHWTLNSTYKERWAEAIQTEIGDELSQPTTESIIDARPPAPALLITPGTEFSGSVRIPYQLAEAARVNIRINQSGTSITIREIDEGFGGICPAGYYDRNPYGALGPDDALRLHGTSAHWDGYEDYPKLQPKSASYRKVADNGDYDIWLVLNDTTEIDPVTISKVG